MHSIPSTKNVFLAHTSTNAKLSGRIENHGMLYEKTPIERRSKGLSVTLND